MHCDTAVRQCVSAMVERLGPRSAERRIARGILFVFIGHVVVARRAVAIVRVVPAVISSMTMSFVAGSIAGVVVMREQMVHPHVQVGAELEPEQPDDGREQGQRPPQGGSLFQLGSGQAFHDRRLGGGAPSMARRRAQGPLQVGTGGLPPRITHISFGPNAAIRRIAPRGGAPSLES